VREHVEIETNVLAWLIDGGPVPTGFSIIYLELRSHGMKGPPDALAFLFGLEERGWIKVRRYEEDGPRRHKWKVASKRYRQDFLKEHDQYFRKLQARKPRWSQDPDLDYGEFNLHFVITGEGKAEYLQREGPTEDKHAWEAQLEADELTVWAPTEEIARSIARQSARRDYFAPAGSRVAFRRSSCEPAAFELKTGERFDGVRVTYRLQVVAAAGAAGAS
jgi:hypothetical protein